MKKMKEMKEMKSTKKHLRTSTSRLTVNRVEWFSGISDTVAEYSISLSTAILFTVLIAGCGGTTQKEQELHVVTSIEEYRQQVASDKAMELIDLEEVIEDVRLDIRYATENNFTGEVIYTKPKAYVRKPVGEALKRVHDSLEVHGLGVLVYDAYRPYSATVRFYEVYPDTVFVANPKYGSKHNRGCAVDVSLFDRATGDEMLMPTEFDEFSERAHHEYMNLPEEAINNRALLTGVMMHFGFTPYPSEWWHFDFTGWQNYPLMNISFEDLEK
ncbi:MAG: M15 family metallopeptidase [Bacteroidales bacterium]